MDHEQRLSVARGAIWRTREKREILLGQRPDNSKNYPGTWEFPGGKIEPKETIKAAVRREVREETGLTVARFCPASGIAYEYVMDEASSPYFQWLILTRVLELLACDPDALLAQPPEHQKLEWVALDEALRRDLQPQTAFAIPYLQHQQKKSQP